MLKKLVVALAVSVALFSGCIRHNEISNKDLESNLFAVDDTYDISNLIIEAKYIKSC